MDTDSLTAAIRVLSATSSSVLFVLLSAVSVGRWRGLRPSQRLFTLGLGLYTLNGVVVSMVGLDRHYDPNLATVLLPIANIWLTGAIVALQREYKHSEGLTER